MDKLDVIVQFIFEELKKSTHITLSNLQWRSIFSIMNYQLLEDVFTYTSDNSLDTLKSILEYIFLGLNKINYSKNVNSEFTLKINEVNNTMINVFRSNTMKQLGFRSRWSQTILRMPDVAHRFIENGPFTREHFSLHSSIFIRKNIHFLTTKWNVDELQMHCPDVNYTFMLRCIAQELECISSHHVHTIELMYNNNRYNLNISELINYVIGKAVVSNSIIVICKDQTQKIIYLAWITCNVDIIRRDYDIKRVLIEPERYISSQHMCNMFLESVSN